MVWFASLGWLLIPFGVLTGFWLVDYEPSGGSEAGILVGSILCGVALYVIPLVYLGTTRVAVENITDETITLKRASVGFAREVANMK